MASPKLKYSLDADQALKLEVRAAKVFQPRAPVSVREFFAGRWNQIATLADAVGQTGLHVVIYGERGVGKTSLANIVKPIIQAFDDAVEPDGAADEKDSYENAEESREEQKKLSRIVIKANANSGDTFSTIWEKLLEDLSWHDVTETIGFQPLAKNRIPLREAFGFQGPLGVDHVRRIVSRIYAGPVFIIDEFDRAAHEASREFTDLIKGFSDFSVDCTVILVGVAETVDALVSDHASITRSLVQIPLPRMEIRELHQILENAQKALSIEFSSEASNLIVYVSQGLPHYTHLLGLHAVRIAARSYSGYIEKNHVFEALKEAVRQAQQTVTEKFAKATHSAHKDALYKHVLLACSIAAAVSHDALGYFNPGVVVGPLEVILGRSAQIATFSNHLSEFCQEKRGNILERVGQERAYRYRFNDPLLVPFVLMDAIANNIVSTDILSKMLGARF
jgi:Cdc6-like AAA superfamily ATPase